MENPITILQNSVRIFLVSKGKKNNILHFCFLFRYFCPQRNAIIQTLVNRSFLHFITRQHSRRCCNNACIYDQNGLLTLTHSWCSICCYILFAKSDSLLLAPVDDQGRSWGWGPGVPVTPRTLGVTQCDPPLKNHSYAPDDSSVYQIHVSGKLTSSSYMMKPKCQSNC